MRNTLLLLLAIAAGFIGAWAYGHFNKPQTGEQILTLSQAQDTVFDKVVNSRTIRCGYITWAPAFIKDANTGQLSGINYEFMEKIGQELGYKIEWVEEVGIGQTPEALNNHRFDVMCASQWPDGGKLPLTEYTFPTYYSAVFAYVREGDTRFDGDLSKANDPAYKACGIEGDITLKAVVNSFPKISIEGLPASADGAQLILNLVSKKCDLILIDNPFANDFLKSNPGTLHKVANVPPVRVYGEHLLVAAGEQRLKNMLDTIIITLIDSGVMKDILKKYPDVYAAPQPFFEQPGK